MHLFSSPTLRCFPPVLLQALHGHFTSTVENICWLAPEVLAQDLSGYSYKSDTYSIGIAALELATGEAPFAGLPVTEVCVGGRGGGGAYGHFGTSHFVP